MKNSKTPHSNRAPPDSVSGRLLLRQRCPECSYSSVTAWFTCLEVVIPDNSCFAYSSNFWPIHSFPEDWFSPTVEVLIKNAKKKKRKLHHRLGWVSSKISDCELQQSKCRNLVSSAVAAGQRDGKMQMVRGWTCAWFEQLVSRWEHKLRQWLFLPGCTHRGRTKSCARMARAGLAELITSLSGSLQVCHILRRWFYLIINNCFLGQCESVPHFQAFLVCKKLEYKAFLNIKRFYR